MYSPPQPFALVEPAPTARRRRRLALGLSTASQLLLAAGLARWVGFPPAPRRPAPTAQPLQLVLAPPRFIPRKLSPPPPRPKVAPPPAMRRLTALPRSLSPPRPRPPARLHVPQPQPVVSRVPLPRLPVVAPATPPRPPVELNRFAAAAAAAPNRPARAWAAAGFGDPNAALTARPSRGNLAAAGFERPAAAPAAGRTGAVASAGFSGASPAPEGSPPGRAAVAAAGFNPSPPAPKPPPPPAIHVADLVPVEILFKPDPDYTPEARRLRIQGEVVLQVVFEPDGHIEVGAVVQSLGHGLDQSAAVAAARIRFRPARRDGVAVATAALVHVVFQLANL